MMLSLSLFATCALFVFLSSSVATTGGQYICFQVSASLMMLMPHVSTRYQVSCRPGEDLDRLIPCLD